jgi:hypothetical protein
MHRGENAAKVQGVKMIKLAVVVALAAQIMAPAMAQECTSNTSKNIQFLVTSNDGSQAACRIELVEFQTGAGQIYLQSKSVQRYMIPVDGKKVGIIDGGTIISTGTGNHDKTMLAVLERALSRN